LFAAGIIAIARMPNVFNVKNYGAVGDGLTLDTAAINKAKEACSSSGGGAVYFPAGTYLGKTA
jgi:polygalacturonase